MTAEELQDKLDQLPSNPPPPPRPAPQNDAGALAQQTLSTLRLVPSSAPSEDTEAERKQVALAARRRRTEERRAEFAPRIRDGRLFATLRRLDTRCGLLLGPSGIGKTAALDWLAARWPGYFVHARELAGAERRHGLGEGYPPEMQRARTTRLLYLDDVGAEEQRDLGCLQEVIEHRYRHGLATFATSGLEAEGLSAYLGAPYVRRLVEQHVRRSDGSEWPVLFFDAHGGRS